MNITNLPAGGANVRVYKTTANGSNFFGNPIPLTICSNSITVPCVNFNKQLNSNSLVVMLNLMRALNGTLHHVLEPSTCNKFGYYFL